MVNGRGVHVLLALAIGVSLTLTAPAVGAQDAVGQVARLEGDALVTRAGVETADPLEPDTPLYLQDRIQTLEGSRIELRFEDGTAAFLGPNSTLHITEFVLSAKGKRDSAVLGLITGIFRAIVSQVLPGAPFEVRTRQVVAAVRGTDWMGEAQDDTFSVVVLDGAVAVQRAGAEVVLRPGEGVDARPGEPLRKKRWGQGRIDRMRERMFRDMQSRAVGTHPSGMGEMRSGRMRSGRSGSR